MVPIVWESALLAFPGLSRMRHLPAVVCVNPSTRSRDLVPIRVSVLGRIRGDLPHLRGDSWIRPNPESEECACCPGGRNRGVRLPDPAESAHARGAPRNLVRTGAPDIEHPRRDSARGDRAHTARCFGPDPKQPVSASERAFRRLPLPTNRQRNDRLRFGGHEDERLLPPCVGPDTSEHGAATADVNGPIRHPCVERRRRPAQPRVPWPRDR